MIRGSALWKIGERYFAYEIVTFFFLEIDKRERGCRNFWVASETRLLTVLIPALSGRHFHH